MISIEGVKQEEQGERYQFGAKAQRHYENAVISYLTALTFNSTSFDALYNGARTTFQLGSEHLPSPDCVKALQAAIEGFGKSHQVALKEGLDQELCIDAMFNEAQATVALSSILDEGVLPDNHDQLGGSSAVELAWKAKGLFEQVERTQSLEMEKMGFTATMNEEDEDDDAETDVGENMGGNEEGGEGIQGSIVTPTQTIETIAESISNSIDLYSSLSDVTELSALAADISSSIDRAKILRQLIPPSQNTSELDLQLSLLSLSFSSTCTLQIPSTSPYFLTPESLLATHQSLLSQYPNDPALLSSLGDYILSISPPTPQTLSIAMESYLAIQKSLIDPFGAHRSTTPNHSIPSLLASNLIAQSSVHLILVLSDTTQQAASILNAKRCLREAIESCGAGYKFSTTSTSSLSQVKSSTPGRTDWTTVSCFREAFFSLLRIDLLETGKIEGGLEMWKAISGGRGGDGRWFLENIRGDTVWEIGEGREDVMWEALLH